MYADLDVKERKVLYELENHARRPNTEIAKKVTLSPQVTTAIIKRLEQREIIKKYIGYVNFHKLGFIDFGLYVKTAYMTRSREKEFVAFIKNHPKVSFFAKTGGNYNFIIGMLEKNSIALNEGIKKISSAFEDVIQKTNIITRISLVNFPLDYLIDVERIHEYSYFGGEVGNETLTAIEKKIVRELAKNARKRTIEIARDLQIPNSTVMSVIKKLERKDILTGYYTMINPEHFGYESFNLLLDIRNLTEKEEESFFNFCEGHPHVRWFIKTLGQWNYEIGVEVPNQRFLQEILSEIQEAVPKIVEAQTLTIFNNYKYNLYPFE